MTAQGIITAAQLMKTGRMAMAASFGYDMVNKKAVYPKRQTYI
jgi:hypothetical protein